MDVEKGFLLNPVHELIRFTLDEVVITAKGNVNQTFATENESNISFFSISLLIYLAGIAIALLLFFGKLLKMWLLIRSCPKTKNCKLVCVTTKNGTPAFSFLNYVFINERMMTNKEEMDKIIEHELSHIKNKHSYDLLFIELIQIFQWFNPVLYLVKKAIKENHEFLADYDVIAGYAEPLEYGKLLIEHSTQIKSYSIAHNFSYSLLKRRLMMINKVKNPIRFSFKLIWVVFALSIVVFACSGPETEKENTTAPVTEDEMVGNNDIQPKTQIVESGKTENKQIECDIYTVVEEMPEYPGGTEALLEYLRSNIVYPESAKEKNIEGRVFVNFVVAADGSVKDAKVLRGIYEDCDNEALRVVSNMPTWKPGKQDGKPVNVSYNIPINFTLGSDNKEEKVYDIVEVMPQYPGGQDEIFSYLVNNIKYPAAAKDAGVSGRVFVSFIVEKDGKVSSAKILRGIGSGCDEEALRVVNAMPDWEPGKNENGEPVRVKFNLPIKFALN